MKRVLQTILRLVVYFLLIFLPMFPGFRSPTAWFFYPVLSALLAATPFLWGAKKWKKFGGAAVYPLFWYILMVAMGELSFPERLITPLVIILIAELVRFAVGYEKQLGLRLAYCVSALAPAMQHLIILTRTDFYYEGAIEEMGTVAYAEKICSYGTPVWFIVLLVVTFAAAWLGTIIAEKLFKDKVIVK